MVIKFQTARSMDRDQFSEGIVKPAAFSGSSVLITLSQI